MSPLLQRCDARSALALKLGEARLRAPTESDRAGR